MNLKYVCLLNTIKVLYQANLNTKVGKDQGTINLYIGGSNFVQASPEIVDLLKAHLRCAPIPEDMKFEGWQTYGRYNKPIHWWIRDRPGEPIPEDMKYDGW